jgi:hypothetical protein
VSPMTQKPFWTGDASKGFKYKDGKRENGAVKSAQIKLKGGAGHVPYVQHRTENLDQTTNFLYWELDLTNAAH